MHDDHAKEQRRGQNLGSLFDERKIGYFSLAWRCFQGRNQSSGGRPPLLLNVMTVINQYLNLLFGMIFSFFAKAVNFLKRHLRVDSVNPSPAIPLKIS